MGILPSPKLVQEKPGTLDLLQIGKWCVDERFHVAEQVMKGYFPNGNGERTVAIEYSDRIPQEGYTLDVTPSGINIQASTLSGALYGLTSLRIHSETDLGNTIVPCVHITDEPKLGYRGILFDVARYFVDVTGVKRLIDLMLLHKLNVLHLHLTDDQGWRIEIKKYPLLTQIGSKREKTNIHGWHKTDDDGTPHSGYYTQEDIRDLVQYAHDRGITIIPEIDMPAHFMAAFAAYPWLGCRELEGIQPAWFMGGKYPTSIGWKDWNRSACIGKESTFRFIFDVIDEVFELFPAPYFHIGGDEAPKEEWKNCPHCQKRKQENGLKSEKELQCYFINRVYQYVKSKGRRLIGWNEVLQGNGLDKDVIVQYWTPTPDRKVAKHLRKGGNVIISKHQAFYFDMAFGQYPLKNTYTFTPKKLGIREKYLPQVLGYEGCLWAEWTPNMHKREFQLFPRTDALAEIAWSSHKLDKQDFLDRLDAFLPVLDALGVNYAERDIAEISNRRERAKITYAWYHYDQDMELRRNEELKAKKGKA